MDSEPTVDEYMTQEVMTVSPTDSVAEVSERISDTDSHNGFPVCADGVVEGFVTGSDLLQADPAERIGDVMSDDTIVADPEMRITDAARVIVRSNIQKLPVVDADEELVGIISNTDVIRSQIERATPEKVDKLRRTLTEIHGVDLTHERQQIELETLIPTQKQVFADELEGRRYELERGLAEPLVVIDTTETAADGGRYLADGHHRVLAADRLNIKQMEAYVIIPASPVRLGIARTADEQGLESINDVSVVDHTRHPLVEATTKLQ